METVGSIYAQPKITSPIELCIPYANFTISKLHDSKYFILSFQR